MYSFISFDPGSKIKTISKNLPSKAVEMILGDFVCETIGQELVKISSPANTSFSGRTKVPTTLRFSATKSILGS